MVSWSFESVQYKPKEEENTIEKYMNYEVEEEKTEETNNIIMVRAFVLISILFWVIVTGIIVALGG